MKISQFLVLCLITSISINNVMLSKTTPTPEIMHLNSLQKKYKYPYEKPHNAKSRPDISTNRANALRAYVQAIQDAIKRNSLEISQLAPYINDLPATQKKMIIDSLPATQKKMLQKELNMLKTRKEKLERLAEDERAEPLAEDRGEEGTKTFAEEQEKRAEERANVANVAEEEGEKEHEKIAETPQNKQESSARLHRRYNYCMKSNFYNEPYIQKTIDCSNWS